MKSMAAFFPTTRECIEWAYMVVDANGSKHFSIHFEDNKIYLTLLDVN